MQKNRFRKTENTRNCPFRIKCSSWHTHYQNEKKAEQGLAFLCSAFLFYKNRIKPKVYIHALPHISTVMNCA